MGAGPASNPARKPSPSRRVSSENVANSLSHLAAAGPGGRAYAEFWPGDRPRFHAGARSLRRDRQPALPGNHRGGVWLAQNAATSNPSNVVFAPLRIAWRPWRHHRRVHRHRGPDGAAGRDRRDSGRTATPTTRSIPTTEQAFCAPPMGQHMDCYPDTADQLWSFDGEGFAGLRGARSIRNWLCGGVAGLRGHAGQCCQAAN